MPPTLPDPEALDQMILLSTGSGVDHPLSPPATLIQALREGAPDLEPAGIAAGLHLIAYLPSDLDETTLVEAAARRGLAVYGVAPYRISSDGRGALIFGYATLPERTIVEGVEVLAEAIDEVR